MQTGVNGWHAVQIEAGFSELHINILRGIERSIEARRSSGARQGESAYITSSDACFRCSSGRRGSDLPAQRQIAWA
jgi:hypothetical protein